MQKKRYHRSCTVETFFRQKAVMISSKYQLEFMMCTNCNGKGGSLVFHILWYPPEHYHKSCSIVLLGRDTLVPRRVCRNVIWNLDQNKTYRLSLRIKLNHRTLHWDILSTDLQKDPRIPKWTTVLLESIKKSQDVYLKWSVEPGNYHWNDILSFIEFLLSSRIHLGPSLQSRKKQVFRGVRFSSSFIYFWHPGNWDPRKV